VADESSVNTLAREPAPPRATGRTLLAACTFLIAVAALAIAGYQLTPRGGPDFGAAIASFEARIASLGRENEKLEGGLDALRGKIDTLTAELVAARDRIDALQAGGERDDVELALAEAEYLLVMATQRLALERDARTALAAMEAADQRLVGLDAPAITELRAQFARDMNALRAVPEVDVAGLSLFLADLIQRAEDLPLRDEYLRRREMVEEPETVPEEPRGWRGFWQGIWQEISRHMVITRAEQGAHVVLLPEERFFLVHNLRLQLETVRLAVLRGDTASFRASLAVAAEWIREYYDTGDAAVANVLDSLQRMSSLRLDPELPDISSSLESTRALMHERLAGGQGETGQ
jgi:uroporphyrin-3 C-methyltransferase